MQSTKNSDRSPRSVSARIYAVCVLVLGAAGLLRAFVHDGKSFAIEAAIPQLELQDNPFVLREAWWNGELGADETRVLRHQLFKRNEYWFWLGCSDQNSEVNIHIYDSQGNLTEAESWQRENVAGVRVVPQVTGTFYIRVAIAEASDRPAEWAVIYAYR